MTIIMGIGFSNVGALPDLGVSNPPVNDEPVNYLVGFFALPSERATYAGEPVTGVNEDLGFFLVAARNPLAFQARAGVDENVRYIQEDLEAFTSSLVPNDTFYNQYQYDMKPATTNMELAWDKGFGTTATKVCIGDTGANRAHEDLVGATYYFWKDQVNGKTAAYDDNGHGSHVTGTVGATPNNAKGVAGISKVSIGNVKLLNRQGSGTISQVANGITSCTNSGSHIQSYSLGTTGDFASIRDAIAASVAAGNFIAAASGNGGCTNCVEFPAKYTGVTGVGSTGKTNVVSSFTSQGAELDFSAPGESIPSTWSENPPCNKTNANTCYVLSSGTSMATPHVAGLAGLVKSNNPTFTATQIYDRLKVTALDLGAAGRDTTYGEGLIQGAAA